MTKTTATTAELIAAIVACKTDADRSRMGALLTDYFTAIAKHNPLHGQLMIVEQVAEAHRIPVSYVSAFTR